MTSEELDRSVHEQSLQSARSSKVGKVQNRTCKAVSFWRPLISIVPDIGFAHSSKDLRAVSLVIVLGQVPDSELKLSLLVSAANVRNMDATNSTE